MCMHICYKVNYCEKREVCVSNSKSMALRNFHVFRVLQKGGRQKEFDHFFRFRDAFGHFLLTFSDASGTFFVTFLPDSFCRTPFAAG